MRLVSYVEFLEGRGAFGSQRFSREYLRLEHARVWVNYGVSVGLEKGRSPLIVRLDGKLAHRRIGFRLPGIRRLGSDRLARVRATFVALAAAFAPLRVRRQRVSEGAGLQVVATLMLQGGRVAALLLCVRAAGPELEIFFVVVRRQRHLRFGGCPFVGLAPELSGAFDELSWVAGRSVRRRCYGTLLNHPILPHPRRLNLMLHRHISQLTTNRLYPIHQLRRAVIRTLNFCGVHLLILRIVVLFFE